MSSYDRDYYRPSGFGGFSVFPPIIKNLLIINGVVYFLMLMMRNITIDGMYAEDIIIRWFALMPIGSSYFEVWQLITYQFLHGGFGHILFNMFALWMFGMEIENLWGGRKFLLFYLLSGVGAGLLHLFLSPVLTGGAAPTIGASGAVYGIMVAFALIFPDRPIYLYFFIPIKAKYLITFLILMEFMLVDSVGSGVAHLAHLGGAIVGFFYVMLDKRTNVDLKDMLNSIKSKSRATYSSTFAGKKRQTQDATFYEIEEDDETISQEEIDAILDKISQSGYKNLSDKEKRILFEASKKMK